MSQMGFGRVKTYTVRQRVSSFNHLVGTHEERFGDRNPEDFRGPEVDNHLKPRGALNGQISRFGAAQNPRDVAAGAAKHVGKIRSVGDETFRVHMRPVKVYRWQACLCCELSNSFSVSE